MYHQSGRSILLRNFYPILTTGSMGAKESQFSVRFTKILGSVGYNRLWSLAVGADSLKLPRLC